MIKQYKFLLKIIFYPLFPFILIILKFTFKTIGFKKSSFVGKYLGLFVGYFHPATLIAKKNISTIYPHLTKKEISNITRRMWINLGRNFGEFLVINKCLNWNFVNENIECSDLYKLKELSKKHKKLIILSAHYGAWEIVPKITNMLGVKFDLVYRHINNQFLEKMVSESRLQYARNVIPKGIRGSKKIISILSDNEQTNLCMLMDQKMLNGIETEFLGHKAWTSSSAAELSARYNVPIVMLKCERIGDSAKFKITIGPVIEKCLNDKEEIKQLTQKINNIYSEWINEKPEQWFWVHNRWRKNTGK
jgi:KDO2-lipid IV(A) lauroyltransferase